jgi:hypothetical protein
VEVNWQPYLDIVGDPQNIIGASFVRSSDDLLFCCVSMYVLQNSKINMIFLFFNFLSHKEGFHFPSYLPIEKFVELRPDLALPLLNSIPHHHPNTKK